MKNPFYGESFITVDTLTKETFEYLLEKADEMKKIVLEKGGTDSLKGRIMGTMFYEPSSRTFASFVAAMQRLGGGFIPLNGMTNTSVAKGESLTDSAQVFASYSDVLVMRNPVVGSVKVLDDASWVPVINAGDGVNEHPTQALLDAYTIHDEFGTLENLHVVFVGEMAHYRPVNSLAKLLALYPSTKISFVSHPEVALQPQIREYLKSKNIQFTECEHLEDVIEDADVLYVTRPKKEFMSEEVYKRIQGKYVVDANTLSKMKQKSIIMHPLPRLEEIHVEVDADPRAIYLTKQMKNGMYMRMALIESILKQ
jgi:aspartate carbamoyltransferase